jgi:CRISPR-associated exonuclease Cas4/CRISPR-associated protein Cas1
MVNEYVYCPRLAWLMWVDGQWADSGDTEEGRRAHARVDKPGPPLPEPETQQPDDAPVKTRAVTLASERLGLIAKLDVVETSEGVAIPVDTKKGKRPHVAEGAYEPERVQICAQGLVLEDNGWTSPEGAIWYAESRERVRIPFDEALRAQTLEAISRLRLAAAAATPPPPLVDSPKCTRCSLAGICLPDEVNFFKRGYAPRPLNPGGDPALPLYVQTPGARVRKDGERIVVETDDGKVETPLTDISQLVLMGPINITTPAIHALLREELPISFLSSGGWLMGHAQGTGAKNVGLRIRQFAAAADDRQSLNLARGLVVSKLRNARTMLRRNWKDTSRQTELEDALARLKRAAERAATAKDPGELLGLEGEGAAIYFRMFAGMIAAPSGGLDFAFDKRERRPPLDPVNALLSFAYALLVRHLTTVLSAVGFDPYCGFYHRPRHGRPALSLDMMEPLRPIVADSTVLTAINNGEVQADGFLRAAGAVALKPPARRAFIQAFERRLDQETTHPVFGYRISMRRLIEVQGRLLARHLQGEIPEMPHYEPR